MEKIILTGDRPTGKLHLGHYVGSIKKRLEMQSLGDYSKMYVMIADSQALTDNFDNPDKIRDSIKEIILDYLAVGLDPKKVVFFIQSMIPELTEYTFYYLNLVSLARLERNPTVKSELTQKEFRNNIPMGFLCYPVSQAADITLFRATDIPVGVDQLPMLEQTNEIVRKFNSLYGDTLVECKALLPDNETCFRLPGTDGKNKMSKSLGNGIDPMDMIEKYGVDSLRYYLATDCALGTDLRFDETKMASTWNFINKLWNASRFTLMNIETLQEIDFKTLTDVDKWILTKYENIIKSITKHMDKYEFNLVGSELYNFIWEDFCSNYIEYSKFNLANLSTKSTLLYVLTGILKMLHPFMPFVSEEIYDMLPIKDSKSIMISNYPEVDKKLIFKDAYLKVEQIIDFVKVFRNIKQENNIGHDFKVKITTIDPLIIKILKLDDKITDEELNITKYHVSNNIYTLDLYFEKIITEEDEKLKEKQIETLKANILRREKLLSNEGYLNKAPKELVLSEQEKLKQEKALLETIV